MYLSNIVADKITIDLKEKLVGGGGTAILI